MHVTVDIIQRILVVKIKNMHINHNHNPTIDGFEVRIILVIYFITKIKTIVFVRDRIN